VGVISSVALIIAGTMATFVQHPAYFTSSTELEHIVAPGAKFPHSIGVLLTGLHQLRGEAIVTLGLLVLLATPMMRVGVSVAAFIYYRDRIYILVTATVLGLLLLALVLLICSGLMARTFMAMTKIQAGFTRPAELQTFVLNIPKTEIADDERVIRTMRDASRPGRSRKWRSSTWPVSRRISVASEASSARRRLGSVSIRSRNAPRELSS